MEDSNLVATVEHSSGSYPILVGWGLLEGLGQRVASLGIRGPVYMISDENVFPLHGRRVQQSLEARNIATHSYVIPPGEGSKTLGMAGGIYEWLAERRAERSQAIIAVGGGVVGDLAGFVAATFLRGMPLIQVPTSLAAMVDASIGGKVAVNLPKGKNLIGSFYQPRMVLTDLSCLDTLGGRELAEGWAEAVKYGLILDKELWETFEEHAEALVSDVGTRRQDILSEIVGRCAAIKAQIVMEDELDTLDRRVLLNYGHTIGHAIEASAGYGRYLHGEAVSVGMMGAGLLSVKLGMIGEGVVERQRKLLERFRLPTSAPDAEPERLFDAMSSDKKKEGGSIKWVLLEGIGKSVARANVPVALVKEAVDALCGPQR